MEKTVTQTGDKPKRSYNRKPKAQTVDAAAILASPEAQAIIAATAERLANDLLAKRQDAGTASQPGDMTLVRGLAVAINELNGQNKKIVPAELLERRRNGQADMEELILEARSKGMVPEYELTRAQYLDEVLVAPTYVDRNHVQTRTRIEWPKVPNEGMRPVNDIAHRIYNLFLESIGGATANINAGQRSTIPEKAGDLRVVHLGDQRQEPSHVGKPRSGDLKIVGRHQQGDVVETAILGTVAQPARQIA